MTGLAMALILLADGPVRAQPAGNLASYVLSDDYPASAIMNREQGMTAFRLTIDPSGAVSRCEVTRSSGSAALDATTCSIMTRRARFTPARDSAGNFVEDVFESRITWQLEPGCGGFEAQAPAAPPAGARHWVQIATGANRLILSRQLRRLEANAPWLLCGQAAATARAGPAYRLLVGPFGSAAEAQELVNALGEVNLAAAVWTRAPTDRLERLRRR